MAERVGDARDERSLGPDHDEIDRERPGEVEQSLAVVGANWMAAPERCDAGIPGGGVKLGEDGAPGEAPGERVLATTGADEKHPHGPSLRRLGPARSRSFRCSAAL